ncbi:MAG: MarR family winged helix-turn-helix transcriptional regulator [Dehalococcoidia bacterium]
MERRPAQVPDAEELATWRAFLEAHARVIAVLDRQLADSSCGLDLREYDLLVLLSEAGEAGLRLRELAERALISRSNVTRRAEALVARGLLARHPVPDDGRGVIATITPAGTRALRRAATVHLPGVKRLVFPDPTPSLQQIRDFLERVAST